jgi:hypothetical protein
MPLATAIFLKKIKVYLTEQLNCPSEQHILRNNGNLSLVLNSVHRRIYGRLHSVALSLCKSIHRSRRSHGYLLLLTLSRAQDSLWSAERSWEEIASYPGETNSVDLWSLYKHNSDQILFPWIYVHASLSMNRIFFWRRVVRKTLNELSEKKMLSL